MQVLQATTGESVGSNRASEYYKIKQTCLFIQTVKVLRNAIASPTFATARRSISSTTAKSFAGHDVDALAASFKGYYVQKNLLQPNPKLKQRHDVKGKTAFISGGSRGIGLDIAKKLAAAGANVVLAAKTVTEQPNLPGTITQLQKSARV